MSETRDTQVEQRIRRPYDNFNARDIEAVLAGLTPDVVWTNGMEGGSADQTQLLADTTVRHLFTFENGLISRFDID